MEIEAMPVARFVRPIYAVCVELTRMNALQPDVPDVTSAISGRIQVKRPGRCCVCGIIKQFQPDTAGISTEERKVDSLRILTGSKGQRHTPSNFGTIAHLRDEVGERAWLHRCQRIHAASNGTDASLQEAVIRGVNRSADRAAETRAP